MGYLVNTASRKRGWAVNKWQKWLGEWATAPFVTKMFVSKKMSQFFVNFYFFKKLTQNGPIS